MICYETEKEAQSAITEINQYIGWTAEKYIKKATRTGNQSKERTKAGSKKIETEENDREKTNQIGIKDKRTCFSGGKKGHKTKDCESKLHIFIIYRGNLDTQELKGIKEEYGTLKSIKIKKVQTERKKRWWLLF